MQALNELVNKKIISTKNIYGVAKVLTVETLNCVYHITYDLEHNGVSATLLKGEVITIVDNGLIINISLQIKQIQFIQMVL